MNMHPPVLRRPQAGTPWQTTPSDWSHADFIRDYEDEELQAILDYLAEVIR